MSRVPALLVTHADLADALVRAAERIYGPVDDLDRLSNDGYSRESLEREIVTLRAETGRLTATVNRLRTDPDFIEQVAREDLGLVKPGERVLKLPPSPGQRGR